MTDSTLSWFSSRCERARTEIFTQVAVITPDIASHILAMNDGNRPPDLRIVHNIARDINSGHWAFNGESIIISREGSLNDGQHRLMAVVESGTPIMSVIIFGVARESRMTVDQGRSRSVGNYLSMDGAINATHCAAVANYWGAYNKGFYGKPSKVNFSTRQDVRQFYNDHKAKIDTAVRRFRQFKEFKITHLSVAYLIIREIDNIRADGFFAMLMEGANLDRDDPILWLRNRLTTGTFNEPSEYIEAILRYWMAWRANKKLKQHLQLRREWPNLGKLHD